MSLRGIPALLGLALAAAATSACAPSGLPWVREPLGVRSVEARGGFLDVQLGRDQSLRRVIARDTETCREVLALGETVGLSGRADAVTRGDLRCDLVGIGDLDRWRVSRTVSSSRNAPGRMGASPISRQNQRIVEVYADEEVRFFRGGFSIAGLFLWQPGTDQVVAMVPRGETCELLVSESFVSVLFRQAGRPALALATREGPCPIQAVFAVQRTDFPDAPPFGLPNEPRAPDRR